MIKIEHIAVWVNDLEKMKEFYMKYFKADPGEKYENKAKNYSSYFMRFDRSARLELMHRPDISERFPGGNEYRGWAHIALGLGSRKSVLEMTEKLRNDGYQVVGEPRTTGDGYFESVILDPEDNRIELTI
jgi:lactoylglutathione lyase